MRCMPVFRQRTMPLSSSGLMFGPLAGVLKVFGQDQAPGVDVDFQADRIAGVRVDRHFVGITSPFAVEFAFHDVTRRIGMGPGVLHTIDPLGEDAALGHGVHRINDRLHEIWPTRDLGAERMGQIDKYFLSHFQ